MATDSQSSIRTVVLGDTGATEVSARWSDESLWIAASDTEALLGWEVKPEGLCRGDVCVLPGDALVDGEVALVAAAELTGRPALADPAGNVVVLGTENALRRQAIDELELPDIELPTLTGESRSLRHWSGKKKLFAVFASW
jgi:hypothetical protein